MINEIIKQDTNELVAGLLGNKVRSVNDSTV